MSTPSQTKNNGHTSWIETPPLSPSLRHWSGEAIERQSWLDMLADPLQNWAHSLFGTPKAKKLKDVLHGTWFGHPVHPAVTDIPIGSWTATLLFDSLWLTSKNSEFARASDITLMLGLVGASASAATGLADWSETDATDRRVGVAHGLLNAGAMLANLISCGLRFSGRRRAGIMFSSMAYTLTIFSSYLGGELSFAKGIGVNHVAWEAGSDDFSAVIDAIDLPDQRLTRVDANGIPVVLWKDGEKIYALAATCSHAGGPLDEGTCQDGSVTCPWHGSTFRLRDGAVVNGPAVYAQPTFEVRMRNGKIELRRLEHA
ncbi:MAG TPA: Rieske 2Fe-2S domain-containing protein [Ktedonobacteraceae bacterium]